MGENGVFLPEDDWYYADEFDDPTRNLYVEPAERALIRTEDVYQTETEVGTIGYSDTLLSVVANYCNSGRPEGFNAQSMVGKSKKGEVALRLFAVVDPEVRRFVQAGFQTRGCLAVTACASTICSMIEGKTFEEALAVKPQDIADALDGVPWDKSYTPRFAIEAVRALVGDFLIREGASREELDSVVPCDEGSIACLMCESCSLRSSRAELAVLEAIGDEGQAAAGEGSTIAPDRAAVEENNAIALVFDDVRARSRIGALSFPAQWSKAGLVPASMTEEDLEMRVFDYLQDPGSWVAPELPDGLAARSDEPRDEVFGSLDVPEGFRLVELDGEVVLVEDEDTREPTRVLSIDPSGIKMLMGARSYYLYDSAAMTDNYAHWAFLAAEGDGEFALVDVVREESRIYPRPMAAVSFQNKPFRFTAEQVDQLFAQVEGSGRYPDIARTVASDGSVFFYSTEYLSDGYAKSLAEWLAVGREMNM